MNSLSIDASDPEDSASRLVLLPVVKGVAARLYQRRVLADAHYAVRYLGASTLEPQFNLSVSSCNHMVHYRCFTEMMKNKAVQIYPRKCTDFFCPVCRRLAAFYVPILITPEVSTAFRQQIEGGELAVDSAAEKHVLSSLLEKHKEVVNESVWKVVVIAWAHE